MVALQNLSTYLVMRVVECQNWINDWAKKKQGDII